MNAITINDILSTDELQLNGLSDEELAAIFGGSWGDAAGYVSGGLIAVGGALLAAASAPATVPIAVAAGIALGGFGGGLSIGHGIAVW